MGIEAGLSRQSLVQDPFTAVAEHLQRVCDDFEHLLDHPDVGEKEVQQFLEMPKHHFLLSPSHRGVYPHKSLGRQKYIPDFVILKPDGDYHLMQIEDPKKPIYNSSNDEPSAHFTHAQTQFEDWLRYVDDNRDTVRREDELETIYKPTGELVAGRDKHLGKKAMLRFTYKRAESRVTLHTYDLLLKNARAYAESLLRQSGTVRRS